MDIDVELTSRHWDDDPWNTQDIVFWTQLERVQNRLAVKESGRADGDWVQHTLETYYSDRLPLERCLSLGCGRGRVEREWAARKAFLACDAYDISPESISDAQQLASSEGLTNINYLVADLNKIELSKSKYDAVWAVGSAHHFSNLEHVFAQVARSLKRDGLFFLYEYVGANRFQFGERQRQVIEACLKLLPMQYRLLPAPSAGSGSPALLCRRDAKWLARRVVDKVREGSVLSTSGRFWRRRQAVQSGQRPIKETAVPTLRSVMSVDPSEAVRSADIIPVLNQFFDIVEYRPLGGSILQFLLADIAGNFQDEAGEQLLETFFELEDALMTCGDLGSDFAYIAARSKHQLV